MQAPLNNVILKITRKYTSGVSDILRESQINPSNQLNPADLVNIVGEVVSVPKCISDKRDYKGFVTDDIYPGDIAIIRYDVIFSFLEQKENEEPVYKNQFWYKGQSYWAADIQKIFAVVRAGEIIMVNGYCMIENQSAPSGLILPQHMKRLVKSSTATLTHIGKNLSHLPTIDAQPGDTVFFNPQIVQNYRYRGKPFGIISQKHVLGKSVASYSDLQIFN